MEFNYAEIYKIIIASVRESFRWKIWKWIITGGIGSLIGFLKIGKDFLQFSPQKSVTYALIALGILFLVRFFLIFIKKSLQYFHEIYKSSIYGDAIIVLKDSFAQTHFYRKTPGHHDTEFVNTMLLFCNNLKHIYDNTTKSKCSVSIKVPLEDTKVDEKTVLVNLSRDIDHKSRDTKEYMEIKHTLIGNTAFSQSFNKILQAQKEKHYINNSVNGSVNYDNTSKQCNDNGVLPYESELVHPIVPIISKDNKNYDCHGFICIDSNKKNAFTSKYEIAILEGVADGIYDIISERNKAKQNPDGKQ